MKKFLLFLLAFWGIQALGQNIVFADPVFKNSLITGANMALYDLDDNQLSNADADGNGEISEAEAENILRLSFTGMSGISDISGIQYFTNLETLTGGGGMTGGVDLSGLNALKSISFYSASISSIILPDAENSALESLDLDANYITSLNLSGYSNLQSLMILNNPIANLILNDLPLLDGVTLHDSGPGVTLENFTATNCGLAVLYLQQHIIKNILVDNCPNLANFNVDTDEMESFVFTNCPEITTLGLTCNTDVVLGIPDTPLHIDLSGSQNLTQFFGQEFNFGSVDLSDCPNLTNVTLRACGVTSVDFSGSPAIENLECTFNHDLIELDASGMPNLNHLDVTGNESLERLYIKNGSIGDTFSTNIETDFSSLQFICGDDDQLQQLQTAVINAGFPDVLITSYCSFVPGGNYNTLAGNIHLDIDSNGCSETDPVMPFLRLDISDDAVGATFSNDSGFFNFYADAGTYTVTPNFENQSLFNVSPTSATATFADDLNNSETFDFCITPNGNSTDVEVVFSPTEDAIPGFDATYNLVIRNKGNTAVSGNFDLDFDDAVLDFVSSDVAPDAQSAGNLSWNYTNLLPFETRVVSVTFNLNTPMETPALNDGDVLNFSASVVAPGDINPSDNDFDLNDVVINSFDPNDITCLEGDIVNPNQIGEYLHYNVRFENLGTAPARNVVVVLEVDETQYNLPSLQLIDASANSYTRVRGNKVEFIFENIMLNPAAGNPPVGGHGNVLFKMKTDAALQTGDSVLNRANIYFDYNFPIETNDAETVFQELSNGDFTKDASIVAYPNPSDGIVEVKASATIKTLHLFDVQGRLLQIVIGNTTSEKIDISARKSGMYFLKVASEKGVNVIKISRK